MSELYINGKPIIKPMETGTCTWENSTIKVVGTYYKKDNLVQIEFSWNLKQNVNSNSGTGSFIGDMPSNLFPKCSILLTGFAYLQGYTIALRASDGAINFFNRSSSTFTSGNTGAISATYLVD